MKEAHLIVVGKLKDRSLEEVESSYLKRITSIKLTLHEVRAKAENKELEIQEIQKKIKEITDGAQAYLVCLTEKGKEHTSVAFSEWLFKHLEYNTKKLIFIIAGAEGFTSSFLETVQEELSLSRLTFPHKIARILFVEQLYRAMTIKSNHPYHN